MPESNWWSSQTFRAMLLFLVTMVANAVAAKWGVQLDPVAIVTFALTVVAFIMGRQYKSTSLEKARINAELEKLALPSSGEKTDAIGFGVEQEPNEDAEADKAAQVAASMNAARK